MPLPKTSCVHYYARLDWSSETSLTLEKLEQNKVHPDVATTIYCLWKKNYIWFEIQTKLFVS